MQVLLGKNGFIQFYKNGDYRDFACCESVDINFSREVKSVKTVGDGIWKRQRTQSIGYTITCSGLVPWDDDTVVHSFDLLAYLMNATDIAYQIVFNNDNGTVFKVIRGNAGVDTVSFTSPVDFVGSSITLTGNGEPEITDVAQVCIRTIQGVFQVQQADHSVYRISIANISGGQVPRYDYSFDGGAFQTSLGGNWNLTGVGLGIHILKIWPVCDNGIRGDQYDVTINRTV